MFGRLSKDVRGALTLAEEEAASVSQANQDQGWMGFSQRYGENGASIAVTRDRFGRVSRVVVDCPDDEFPSRRHRVEAQVRRNPSARRGIKLSQVSASGIYPDVPQGTVTEHVRRQFAGAMQAINRLQKPR